MLERIPASGSPLAKNYRSAVGWGRNALLGIARRIYHECYGKLPRVRPLHPYWAAMRHLTRLIDRAAENGAANVMVVIGSGGVADTVADHLPGVHSQISLSELLEGNLSKVFHQPIKFDLCICSLGASELARFRTALAVAPYINSGGKIIGFYPNFSLRPLSPDEIAFLENILNLPWSPKIHYAGSDKSARVVRRFHAARSPDAGGRLAKLARLVTMLLSVTPSALAANRSEAAASEENSSRLPKHCTSITIELTVTERDVHAVEVARRHLEKALSYTSPSQPSYGSRWQPQIDAIRRDIPALGDSMACLHYAQKEITFDGRPDFPSDIMQIQFREWAVENEFPDLIPVLKLMSDNPLSYPESLGEFNGKTISRIFYCHARIVLAGITYANRPKRILEIGGGYGEIARLWLTNSIAPAESYVIVDIPECLFFAEVALKAEFGDQVAYFEGHDPGSRILLVPIPYLGDLIRPADLVLNTGSMQEMTDEWIDFYIEWLSKYDTRYFYSLNYIAQPIAVMGESRNLWSQRPGADWSTRHRRLNIPLLDLEGPTRDFLEVLYEKTPATRSLKEWSIYRGHMLTKPTYVEGLDLLRQNFTIETAKTFVRTVMERMPYHPKELLYIVEWLTRQGEGEFESLRRTLREELGGFLCHAPAPPKNS
jgi:hypothetical protein